MNRHEGYVILLRGPIDNAPIGTEFSNQNDLSHPRLLWLDDTVTPNVLYRPYGGFTESAANVRWNSWVPITSQGDPYSWGFFSTLDPALAKDTIVIGANNCFYQRAIGGVAMNFLRWQVVASSGNIGLATYRPSGYGIDKVPGTRTANGGTLACPAIGVAAIFYLDSLFSAGVFMAISVDNATASFRGSAGPLSTLSSGRGWFQTTAHPPPATPSVSGASASIVCLVGATT